MTQPPADPRTNGFRLSWSSNALVWSAAVRRLLGSNQAAEARLAVVAFYLYVELANQLIVGHALVLADPQARASYPGDPRELPRMKTRLGGLRDEILHFADKVDDGREISVSLTSRPKEITIASSIGRQRGRFGHASITKSEIEAFLDRVDPWLSEEYGRLLKNRPADL